MIADSSNAILLAPVFQQTTTVVNKYANSPKRVFIYKCKYINNRSRRERVPPNEEVKSVKLPTKGAGKVGYYL